MLQKERRDFTLYRVVAVVLAVALVFFYGYPMNAGIDQGFGEDDRFEMDDDRGKMILEQRFRLRSRLNTQITMLRLKEKMLT